MCVFSGSVEQVSSTKIFARLAGDEQFLVYAMEFSSSEEVAMILPLPVARDCPENAVRFIDLAGYPGFFDDMNKLFQAPLKRPSRHGGTAYALGMAAASQLEVHEVGAFEASFVPTVGDFSRLDARFRLPDEVWRQLPGYQDFGFVVFKLRAGAQQSVHPMAFSFPTRHPKKLFYPTVHIHDESVHDEAAFGHRLYGQAEMELATWDRSFWQVEYYVPVAKTHGIVSPELPCYRWFVYGQRKNEDIYVDFMGEPALFAAAKSNDSDSVRALLAQGIDANSRDHLERTPLMFARSETVAPLLAAGANPRALSRSGVPLLYEAVSNGADGEAIAALIAAGADPNARAKNGWTPLMEAIWKGLYNVIDVLLENGADINAKSNDGLAPLGLSMIERNEAITSQLVELGADAEGQPTADELAFLHSM